MRREREALGYTHLEMDARIGLASGHWGKVENAGAAWGKQAFRMTYTIECALEALGLELVVAPRGLIEAITLKHDVQPAIEAPRPAPPQRRRKAKPGIVAEYRARLAARISAGPLQAVG
jgi:hypothetical protein